MSWIFEGSAADISLALSETGHWTVYGTATQDCRPASHNWDIVRHVRGLLGLWSIHSIEDSEHHYDGAGLGLKKFFEGNRGKSAALIHYFHPTKTEKAAIGLSIVMPPELAAQVVVTFRAVIGNPAIRYIFCPEFFGISDKAAPSSIPSISEFLHSDILERRGYLSSEITISFRSSFAESRKNP
jgi:hypothetical protein